MLGNILIGYLCAVIAGQMTIVPTSFINAAPVKSLEQRHTHITPVLEGCSGRAFGDIAPYRKSMLWRLADNWHPRGHHIDLTVLITLDHNGQLISSEITESSGSKKADREALRAVRSTEFPPLPAWYKGDTLQFRISITKVTAW